MSRKIQLPDGTCMDRFYDKALIMDKEYQKRYEDFLMTDTREGIVLVYVIANMDENNELVCSLDVIADALKYSRASVARAVKLFRDKYSDLVTVGKSHGRSKFMIDKTKCFVSVA